MHPWTSLVYYLVQLLFWSVRDAGRCTNGLRNRWDCAGQLRAFGPRGCSTNGVRWLASCIAFCPTPSHIVPLLCLSFVSLLTVVLVTLRHLCCFRVALLGEWRFCLSLGRWRSVSGPVPAALLKKKISPFTLFVMEGTYRVRLFISFVLLLYWTAWGLVLLSSWLIGYLLCFACLSTTGCSISPNLVLTEHYAMLDARSSSVLLLVISVILDSTSPSHRGCSRNGYCLRWFLFLRAAFYDHSSCVRLVGSVEYVCLCRNGDGVWL
jgi:hypothetical protein